ncbi:MAG TPA: SDR family oxidoreductase [Opitutaceae bacterium]|nr:SDR family oxidoreductase [Opitutaceae bacterium]
MTSIPPRDSSRSASPTFTAVVTGAGSGVGEAVARALAQHGHRVALVGRRRERLEQVARAIADAGGTAAAFPCDVTDVAAVAALAAAVTARFGAPQIVFNGAGVFGECVTIAESSPALWLDTLRSNTHGPYLVCRAFMADMMRAKWGRIINVSSAAALSPVYHVASAYQLSKVALNHFTRQLASEFAGTGVTANVLHPGEVKTEMFAAIKTDAASRTGAGRDMLKWVEKVERTGGDPAEKTADLVLDLLRPENDGVTGRFLWIKDGLKPPMPSW